MNTSLVWMACVMLVMAVYAVIAVVGYQKKK